MLNKNSEHKTQRLNWITHNWDTWKRIWQVNRGPMAPDEFIQVLHTLRELGMVETIMAMAAAQHEKYFPYDFCEQLALRALTEHWEETAPQVFDHMIQQAIKWKRLESGQT